MTDAPWSKTQRSSIDCVIADLESSVRAASPQTVSARAMKNAMVYLRELIVVRQDFRTAKACWNEACNDISKLETDIAAALSDLKAAREEAEAFSLGKGSDGVPPESYSEVGRRNYLIGYWIQKYEQSRQEFAKLREECDGFRKDAERLDWMEMMAKKDEPMEEIADAIAAGISLRAAIDAAMKAKSNV